MTRIFDRGSGGLCIAILLMLPVLPLLDSAFRAAGASGISGAIPIVQHLTLWTAFAGAVVAVRSKQMLALSTAAALPERWKPMSALIAGAVGGAVSVWLMFSSRDLLNGVWEFGDQLAWGIPLAPALAVMPAGFLMIAAGLWWEAAADWKGRVVAALAGLALGVGPQLTGMQHTGWIPFLGVAVVVGVLLGMPIFAAIGGAAWLLFWRGGIPAVAVADEMYKLTASEFMPAIPLFALAGFILAAGGSGRRLTRALQALVGWMPGGLAVVTTLVLAFFTPLTGASGVTILSMGGLFLPMLTGSRYPEKTSLGLITVSGSIGLLLPPSLPVILYAISARIAIPDLFVAAAVPAVILILAVAAWGAFRGHAAGAVPVPFDLREARLAMWSAKWELLLPVIVLWSYFGGYTGLIETAALTVVYALQLEFAVFRDLSLTRDLPRVALECGAVVGGFLIVVSAALAFANYLVIADIPTLLLELVRARIDSPWVFLLVLNVFLLIVGALMDIYSAILVVVPLILPIAVGYHIDPLHLGVIFLANMELGYLMPPMGENLFLSSLAFKKPLSTVVAASFPYVLALLVTVLLITYVPGMTTLLLQDR